MKQFMLPLLAAILAIGFSAFSNKHSLEASTVEESLYWYPVKENSNEIDHTNPINPTMSYTKSQLASLNLIPCPQVAGTDCIRGFLDPQEEDNENEPVDFTQKAE